MKQNFKETKFAENLHFVLSSPGEIAFILTSCVLMWCGGFFHFKKIKKIIHFIIPFGKFGLYYPGK